MQGVEAGALLLVVVVERGGRLRIANLPRTWYMGEKPLEM